MLKNYVKNERKIMCLLAVCIKLTGALAADSVGTFSRG
jgi:hypothetical protein